MFFFLGYIQTEMFRSKGAKYLQLTLNWYRKNSQIQNFIEGRIQILSPEKSCIMVSLLYSIFSQLKAIIYLPNYIVGSLRPENAPYKFFNLLTSCSLFPPFPTPLPMIHSSLSKTENQTGTPSYLLLITPISVQIPSPPALQDTLEWVR